jgi:hypothetical protein
MGKDSGIKFEHVEQVRPRSSVPHPPSDVSFRIGGSLSSLPMPEPPAPVREKPESPPAPSLSPAAARMRLSRQRHRAGYRTVSVDVHQADVDALIGRGYLRSEEREDRWAIEEAVEFFLESEL